MSQKSNVVSAYFLNVITFIMAHILLGVMLKNENVIDDMVHILDALHKYIPMTTSTQTVDICNGSEATRQQLISLSIISDIY